MVICADSLSNSLESWQQGSKAWQQGMARHGMACVGVYCVLVACTQDQLDQLQGPTGHSGDAQRVVQALLPMLQGRPQQPTGAINTGMP